MGGVCGKVNLKFLFMFFVSCVSLNMRANLSCLIALWQSNIGAALWPRIQEVFESR
jgi:hypothetical protein